MDSEMFLPPGRLQSTMATEATLYMAACDITDTFPFFGLGLSMYVAETGQFVVRTGGASPVSTVNAALAAVAALHNALDRDSGNPFGALARRQFPKCVKRMFAGKSCMEAVAPMMHEEHQMVEAHGDSEELWEFGPAEPAMYGPYPMPLIVQGMIAVLQNGAELGRYADDQPFTVAFALADEQGEAWAAFVGGWPTHAVGAVITLLNSVYDFLNDAVKEDPEQKRLQDNMIDMVREAWKTRQITGIAEDVLRNRKH